MARMGRSRQRRLARVRREVRAHVVFAAMNGRKLADKVWVGDDGEVRFQKGPFTYRPRFQAGRISVKAEG